MHSFWYILVFVSGFLECHCNNATSGSEVRLLLVSFDGFRADYLERYSFPNLKKMIDDGAHVKHLTNVFVTKTFPNHYSIVTGRYAESHGIVANLMYDAATRKNFSVFADQDPFWWNEATPIWVTNQQQGHKSGGVMWPGTDVSIQNTTPSYYLKYDHNVTFNKRVDHIIKWFTNSTEPINFGALYWEEPDSTGHHYGPESQQLVNMLKEVDDHIGYLIEQLQKTGLWNTINVILTSDHGMAQCSKDRVIELDKCIGRDNYTEVTHSPVTAILPHNNISYVYKLLLNCDSHMKVYLKEDIPDRFHYKHNERIQPILLVADEGWTIVHNGSITRMGDHGYDNALPSMHPLLVAHGPAFRKSYKTNTINSVDIYPLMCHILGLKEEANNGTFANVRCLLANELCVSLPDVIGIVIGSLMILVTVSCLIILMKKRISPQHEFARLQLQDDDDDDPLIG
ncbi:bis(5'-adenosyl)-triphosphatase enpp4 [Hemiscyllium ocellatum]|uniref:bis(5'-adenosyl)-triphosphatase enpp4 n=1 Tax=Hemiscyllium ocellatum TaxID=170820 RepID=UPI0029667B8E|nr:bis(5'-adenosyl)-triphosphatase enpp4 [Hemiscyllium ocellatum]XP_060707317.1 bis(5'-adenosyl)-triphosphatase enpp4 [Hemiscyllium ocellatum]XP_060707327.1 bis(5'-adenosyl)-triphosphatase enpp4 [Hemiscyllium ocellatum]